ncbi:MAG: pyridoxamine 5'-phosphate oxidase family protein [Dehalococcoidia bacterium]
MSLSSAVPGDDPAEEEGRSRPDFTPDYGISKTPEGMLPLETVEQWFTASRNYWVVTTRPDGRPHAAPVWGVWLDHAFYFSTDPASRKGRNFGTMPEAVVHLESGDDVAVLEGRVERVTDESLFEQFADAYEAKYQFRPEPGVPSMGVYRLRHRTAYAWREQNFPTSATRWRFPTS